MGKNLKQGIIVIFIANVINMLFSILTNFLLPKFLSVDTYSAIKTFQLYVTYIGALHFGFVDGIYLKYGGREFDKIDKNGLLLNLSTLRIFQFLISVIFAALSIIYSDKILFAFSLSIISLNVISYFKMLYQAVGEFNKYSKLTNLSTILTFLGNMLLLFIINTDDYFIYLLLYSCINLLIWISLEIYFIKYCNDSYKILSFSYTELKDNIKSGFSLMCGNFASFFLTGLDRWFVKIFENTLSFARYSFAVSIENMLNVVVTSITVPLYNYFCKRKDLKEIEYLYQCIIILSLFLVSSAFPLKIVLRYFLPNYYQSYIIIFILFSAQAFQIIIKSIFVNIYKVRKMQNLYLKRLLIVVVSGILFNVILYRIYSNVISFAIGTLLSSLLWFILSVMDFNEIKNIRVYNIIFSILIVIFLICGIYLDSVIGFVVYVLCVLCFTYVFMHDFYIQTIKIIKIKYKKS